jgi:hypothetical protein
VVSATFSLPTHQTMGIQVTFKYLLPQPMINSLIMPNPPSWTYKNFYEGSTDGEKLTILCRNNPITVQNFYVRNLNRQVKKN